MQNSSRGPYPVLKNRDAGWTQALVTVVASSGIRPGTLSLLNVLFATLAMGAYLVAPDMPTKAACALCWLAAAAGIQLRWLGHWLHGRLISEGGRASPTAPLYQEASDRLADVLILVGAGYSTQVEPGVIKLFDTLPLGWTCAVLAMGTAYVRQLQGTLTGRQSSIGPMAVRHRIAVLTGCTLFAIAEQLLRSSRPADAGVTGIKLALVIIALGGVITCARRLRLISARLNQARGDDY